MEPGHGKEENRPQREQREIDVQHPADARQPADHGFSFETVTDARFFVSPDALMATVAGSSPQVIFVES